MSADQMDAGLAEPSATAEAAPAAVARPRLSWREERWERRRRRVWFEEILGWLLVPPILIAAWIALEALLNALGTSPGALIQGMQTIFATR